MNDPMKEQPFPRDHTEVVTPWRSGVDPLTELPAEPLVSEESLAAARKPLFPKRVLIGWALVGLAIWFVASEVLPEIVREIKENLTERSEPAVTSTRVRIGGPGGVTIVVPAPANAPPPASPEAIPQPPAEPAPPATAPPRR